MHTRIDRIPGKRLGRELRVGDECASHPYRVRNASLEERLRAFGIDDARGGDDRWPEAERRGMLGDDGLGPARAARCRPSRDSWRTHRAPPTRSRHSFRHCRLRDRAPVGRVTETRTPSARAGADARIARSTARRKGPPVTPRVLATVEGRIEELLNEVAMRRRHLDAVEAAPRCQLRPSCEAGDDLLQLVGSRRSRLRPKRALGTADGASAGAHEEPTRSARARRGTAGRRGASRAAARAAATVE